MNERSETRQRIVDAATRLLQEQGLDAVTTRAVSGAAGVQPPTIYRLFGDMGGLLEAVAAEGFATYLAAKHAQSLTDDPVDDLRRGWDLHVQFGLEHPAHYLLMFGRPVAGERSTAASTALARLELLVERVAAAGLLVVPVDTAVHMIHSAAMGATLLLMGEAPGERDPELSARVREAMFASVTATDVLPARTLAQHAVALKAALGEAPLPLTAAEEGLLREYLDRLSQA